MDAQPKIGGFGCFKGVLQIPFFLLMQFHKAIFYFNPKMGHMLDLAIVDKLNRAQQRGALRRSGTRDLSPIYAQ